ncbi:PilN domain-containing protein [Neisseria animalis]|uniref:Pilus assembly protein PilP n=1 Tax=Neisseria animalis TaxID=492 RepID=A0A5P3MS37_NEIAN|nr:PilN domain-containing protein [Neisseria animalis]QEY24270.1 pilus assembly protein PilP [Neisseria animalis]ROW32324.1 pilus assembly protein PilP [Neisseria animalis]VEE06661.1 PilN [Neisseria animalis]
MIEPIKINLLPYRETDRQKRKQQFKILMLVAAATGLCLSAVIYATLNTAIANQENRNRFLESEIAKLDQNLGEIQQLQQEKADFLSKKQTVEELQRKRYQAARIIDSLNTLTPEQTYLTSLEAEDSSTYKLSGRAANDNKVAVLMRALPASGTFEQPELLGIKKTGSHQEFSLKIRLTGTPQNRTTLPQEQQP